MTQPLIDGKYQLVEVAGEGGMATVYVAKVVGGRPVGAGAPTDKPVTAGAPTDKPGTAGAPTDKPGTATTTKPTAPTRPAKPKDQVGSAGISSQF